MLSYVDIGFFSFFFLECRVRRRRVVFWRNDEIKSFIGGSLHCLGRHRLGDRLTKASTRGMYPFPQFIRRNVLVSYREKECSLGKERIFDFHRLPWIGPPSHI